jgi:RNA polymerase sigma factor (sigma-70 family)
VLLRATPCEISLSNELFPDPRGWSGRKTLDGPNQNLRPKPTHREISDPSALARARRSWALENNQKGLTPEDLTVCALGYRAYILLEISKRLHTIPDKGAAEQVFQDVLFRLTETADRYDAGKANEMTWMKLLASRASIDYLRRTKKLRDRRHSPLDEDRPTTGTSTFHRDPASHAITIETKKELFRAINKLPTQMRELVQFQLAGFTLSGIATELGVPLGTVKSAWFRTLEKLREDPKLQELVEKMAV